jgi:hypothetical protein
MKKSGKIILYGFIIWLVPFLVSFAIYPLKASNNALFESIMPVIISIITAVFTVLYFKKVRVNFRREGQSPGRHGS